MSDLLSLHAAIASTLRFRSHVSGCDIDRTEFCTCGLREAMDELNRVWLSYQSALAAPVRTETQPMATDEPDTIDQH